MSSQGYKSNCSTIDTGCNISDLRCGQDYNITVVAEHGGCRSQPSQPFTVSTGSDNENWATKLKISQQFLWICFSSYLEDYEYVCFEERWLDYILRSFSFLLTLNLGACPHSSPRVLLDCSSNSALVSWMPGYHILYYNVSANASAVVDHVTCSTTGVSCNVTNLQCAQTYQISVSGQGYTCPSPAKDWVSITSGNKSLKYQS